MYYRCEACEQEQVGVLTKLEHSCGISAKSQLKESAPQLKRLTKWEAGNELVRLADALGGVAQDLEGWEDLQLPIKKMRAELSTLFYSQGLDKEMGFGI